MDPRGHGGSSCCACESVACASASGTSVSESGAGSVGGDVWVSGSRSSSTASCSTSSISLVGPRPLWLPEAERAGGDPASQTRWAVKPGLTCLWQISGRSELSYEDWVALDLYYIHHRSTLLDLLIILQTIPTVLSTRGAY